MQYNDIHMVGWESAPSAADAVAAFVVSHSHLRSPRYVVFPGFCDVHVHFREPGFSYKETIRSGTQAAAHGGYTAVCTMPNLSPVPEDAATLRCQTDRIAQDACIHVYPYGAITRGQCGAQLSDMEGLVAGGAIAFSDDGRGVQDGARMREAMVRARALGRMIVAHCEDDSLLHGGYVHAGAYARQHGHRGIVSESEWGPIARDLSLVRETGCAYHVCHISCRESVALIRAAKEEGLPVTCETAPHYLLLSDRDMQEDGRFKMNPPLRGEEDRAALLEGLRDGTIDMIATDHAPHSAEEKSRGLEKSAFGIVGLETAFPLLYTGLVRTGLLSLPRLIDAMAWRPRARFGIPLGIDCTIWDLEAETVIDPATFLSRGRATPFAGAHVFGRCIGTVCDGHIVYEAQ